MPLFKITRRFRASDARQGAADLFIEAADAQEAMTLLSQRDPDLADARLDNQLSPPVLVSAAEVKPAESVK